MSCERPPPSDLWRAVEAYLSVAYGDRPPPPAVVERLARLRAAPADAIYESEAFERDGERRALRLGNRLYPHMKLVVEPSPSGVAHFRADAHDRHVLDVVGADPAFADLMAHNHATAREIEAAWDAAGLRTSAAHWRDELARWHASRP